VPLSLFVYFIISIPYFIFIFIAFFLPFLHSLSLTLLLFPSSFHSSITLSSFLFFLVLALQLKLSVEHLPVYSPHYSSKLNGLVSPANVLTRQRRNNRWLSFFLFVDGFSCTYAIWWRRLWTRNWDWRLMEALLV
jgi:hypothetical protein